MEIDFQRIIANDFFYRFVNLFVLALLVGCGANDRNTKSPEIALQVQMPDPKDIEGRFKFFIGGGESKKFSRAKRKGKYVPIEIVLVSGDEKMTTTKRNEFGFQFIRVGFDNPKGKEIASLINKLKPWEWKGFEEGISVISNALFFHGQLGQYSWKYNSAFPDEDLEMLLDKIRRIVLR